MTILPFTASLVELEFSSSQGRLGFEERYQVICQVACVGRSSKAHRNKETKNGLDKIKTGNPLYVVENHQGVCRDINSLTFPDTAPVALLGVSTCSEVAEIERAASLCPDVLLLVTRKLERNVIEALKQVREDNPSIGLVLLSMYYDADDIELLTRLTLIGEGGTALFLEQSLDPIEKLSGIVLAVSQGEIIFDPALLAALSADAPIYQFLRRLSAREVEIMDLLSKGYTDSSIADTLDIDAKTVGQHISGMYDRLKVEASL